MRNPERIMSFIHTLKRLEGKKFDHDCQKHFQIMLIQDKHYKPTEMTEEQRKCFESEQPMEFKVAKEIFDSQNYTDPAMRGRLSFALLKKMGLCLGSANDPIRITELGNEFLSPENDMGDLFFNYFLKLQFPNPINTDFGEDDGFLIVPFLGTLHLIHKVNNLWKDGGNKPVGISKKEFSLFVPTLIDHRNIDNQAKQLIEYRKTSENDKDEFKRIFLERFLNSDDTDKINKLSSNLKDYGDNIIRYFRLTRYIRIRGNGFFVDLEPRRMIEISELLNSYRAVPRDMTGVNEYVEYLSDKHQPKLPWKRKEVLSKIKQFLLDEISENMRLLVPFQIPIPEIPKYNELELAKQNDVLKSHLLELQNIQKYYDMGNVDNITKCIDTLLNIRNSENKPSIELEKQAALSLMALNDAIKIKPNYPVGDDGEPTFTAPAGVSDLECFYEQFNLICEVTMLTDRSQWVNEGQPVMRHLREFEEANNEKISYCLFLAPKIHIDTANTFWNAVKYEYRGRSQKIIPLRIDLFVKLLQILQKYKDKNQTRLSHTEVMSLYDDIINLVQNVESSDVWIEEIPKVINKWEKCLLN